MKSPTLIGTKVTLRQREVIDGLNSRVWSRNPKIDRFMKSSWGNLSDAEETKHVLKTQRSKNSMGFAIDDNSTGQHIGGCHLEFITPNLVEMGIYIGETKLHNKGYGTEAISILRDYVFSQTTTHRFQLMVCINNTNAIHCYEKCGFEYEGTLRDYYKKGKQFCTVNQMSLLRPEWNKLTKNGKTLSFTFPK